MRRFPTYVFFACTLPAFVAQAGEPEPPAKTEKAQSERVQLGATSVTVVDEHEAVDDVISRIRAGKTEIPATEKSKTTEKHDPGTNTATTTDVRQSGGRASLRTRS